MPLYKEDSFLVVYPGSEHTIFTFGFLDVLQPPQFRIPSVVYQSPSGEYHATNEPGFTAVKPIVGCRIVNLDAFNHLLKAILQSVITNNPIVTINHIPLLLITHSLTWSRIQIEYITKYVIELLEFTAFNILDFAVASTFGIGGGTTSAAVIKVGHESTQIVPVVNYQPLKFAGKYLAKLGSQTINSELAKILPNFTPGQIEDLKVSEIFEVLHHEAYYSLEDLQDEGENLDVAKLVAEGKNGEKEEEKPNSDLETNTFVDSATGETILVGKERFQGTSAFVAALAKEIYQTLSRVPDLEKRQECYDNMIFVGSTFRISGLREAVILKLATDYLVRDQTDNAPKDVNSAIVAYQQGNATVDNDGEHSSSQATQVPGSIRLAKYPEYFSEWKKPKEKGGAWHDVHFLGGEIFAKQIFSNNSNHGRALFVDSDIYEEKGPQAIWIASI